jgi:hypothetical protein
MAASSIAPKRHWFLQLRRDRQQSTYHVFDSLTFTVLTRGLPSLRAGKDELRRLKHLPIYRDVATEHRPPVPWSTKNSTAVQRRIA